MAYPSKVAGPKGSYRRQAPSVFAKAGIVNAALTKAQGTQPVYNWNGFTGNLDKEDKQLNLELKQRLEQKKASDAKAAAEGHLVVEPPKSTWRPVVLSDKNERIKIKSSDITALIPTGDEEASSANKMKSTTEVDLTTRDDNKHLFTQDTYRTKINMPINAQPARESITTAGSSDQLFSQEGPIVVKIPVMAPRPVIKLPCMTSKPATAFSPLAPEFTPAAWYVQPTSYNMPNEVASQLAPEFATSTLSVNPISNEVLSPQVKDLESSSAASAINGLGINFHDSAEVLEGPAQLATIVETDEELHNNDWLTTTEIEAKEAANKLAKEKEIKVKEEFKTPSLVTTEKQKEFQNSWMAIAQCKSSEMAKKYVKVNKIKAKEKFDDPWMITAEHKEELENPWLLDAQFKAKNADEASDNSSDDATAVESTPPTSEGSTIDSDSDSVTGEVVPKLSKWSLTRFKRGTTLDEELKSNPATAQVTSTSITNDTKTTTPAVREWGGSWGKPLSKAILRDGSAIGGSATAIGDESKGHAMMAKMGWTPGTALGSKATGRLEPVVQVAKFTKRGLGAAAQTIVVEMTEEEKAGWGETMKSGEISGDATNTEHTEDHMSAEDRRIWDGPTKEEILHEQRLWKQRKSDKNYFKKLVKINMAIANGDEEKLAKLTGGQRYRGNNHTRPKVAYKEEVLSVPGTPDML